MGYIHYIETTSNPTTKASDLDRGDRITFDFTGSCKCNKLGECDVWDAFPVVGGIRLVLISTDTETRYYRTVAADTRFEVQ